MFRIDNRHQSDIHIAGDVSLLSFEERIPAVASTKGNKVIAVIVGKQVLIPLPVASTFKMSYLDCSLLKL